MRHTDDLLDDFDGRFESRRYAARDAVGDIAGSMAETLGERIREQPGTFAGFVTFIALFGFVGANALWSQPFSHTNAFYSTRDHVSRPLSQAEAADIVRQGIIAAQDKAAALPPVTFDASAEKPMPEPRPVAAASKQADPTVLGVQATLKQLQLYSGEVDGISGSRTRQAILAYQAILKIKATGEIDEELLAHLRAVPANVANGTQTAAAPTQSTGQLGDGDIVASIRPTPRPDPAIGDQPDDVVADADSDADQTLSAEQIKLMQAGLRQHIDPELDIDGQLGTKTRQAIAQFQEIYRLPVTGTPDLRILKELRSRGFIN
jgi:peptidoglycan hydrolase-like protein with peptidoglycan-binding domain